MWVKIQGKKGQRQNNTEARPRKQRGKNAFHTNNGKHRKCWNEINDVLKWKQCKGACLHTKGKT